MLKNYGQTEMELSPYQGLYDAIIPKEHILRRLKENIDFSFVNPMLKKQYCEHFGRPAKEPPHRCRTPLGSCNMPDADRYR